MSTNKLPSMSITIEQHHIENAERKNSHHCAIADAIKEAVPDAKFISVDLQSIRFSVFDVARSHERVGIRYFYFTPTLAQVAVLKFDEGKRLRPFSFTMRAGYTKQIAPPKKDKVKRSRKSKNVRKYTVKKEREFGIRKFTEVEKKELPKLVKNPNALKANVSKAL